MVTRSYAEKARSYAETELGNIDKRFIDNSKSQKFRIKPLFLKEFLHVLAQPPENLRNFAGSNYWLVLSLCMIITNHRFGFLMIDVNSVVDHI